MKIRVLDLGVVLMALIACNPAAGQNPVVRDSAGVRIVENPARTRAPVVFRLGTTPIVNFGGPEEDKPESEFKANQGYLRGARLSDNRFAAIDVYRIQYFDGRGKRMRMVGRNGSGPEEFRNLMSICRTRGDTLVVADSHNSRFAILDRNGTIVRLVRQVGLGSLPFDACFDDGTILVERIVSELSPGTIRTYRLSRLRVDGSLVSTIGDFTFPPFDLVTQSSPSFVAQGQRVYVGDPWSGEIRVYTAAGKLSRIIRSADQPERITDAQIEERPRGPIRRGTTAAQLSERAARVRSFPRPATWPAYRVVQVDPRG